MVSPLSDNGVFRGSRRPYTGSDERSATRMRMRWIPWLVFVLSLASCVQMDDSTTAPIQPSVSAIEPTVSATVTPSTLPETDSSPAEPDPEVSLALTYHRPDGNRWISGQATLPDAQQHIVDLQGTPAWVVGASTDRGIIWVVTLVTGENQTFILQEGHLVPSPMDLPALPPGAPPVLSVAGSEVHLLENPLPDPAPHSHPVLLQGSSTMGALDRFGQVYLLEGSRVANRTDARALPDARILTDGAGRMLILGAATDHYAHGVLGDRLEAGNFTLFNLSLDMLTWKSLPFPDQKVAEGISPLWVDLTGDGRREILVTLSDAQTGAQLALMDENGGLIATSEPIGQGFRWRHQIAAAPLGPDGSWEIVSNRTPHLGGVVEYHGLQGHHLVRTARLPGYSSHTLGSRNLDMAAVGDFDGDGTLELLIPTQDKTALAALQRTTQGATEIWRLELGGELVTNLGAARGADGRVALAVGLQDSRLLVWFSYN